MKSCEELMMDPQSERDKIDHEICSLELNWLEKEEGRGETKTQVSL